jgi:hypothetical protein
MEPHEFDKRGKAHGRELTAEEANRLYLRLYGITFDELSRRIEEVRAGNAISHEEARRRILESISAADAKHDG